MTLASNRGSIERAISDADLLIGAVLVAGGRAPVVVTKDMVATMRPGSVVVDVAVDQGGCIETTHETTHSDPTYFVDGVLHYAVGNMPAAVPHTSTYALTNATFPFVVALAEQGVAGAIRSDAVLRGGVNTVAGSYANAVVAEALGADAVDPLELLAG
jgi:alanine dehydrogenase